MSKQNDTSLNCAQPLFVAARKLPLLGPVKTYWIFSFFRQKPQRI